jgi:hypothetical protein
LFHLFANDWNEAEFLVANADLAAGVAITSEEYEDWLLAAKLEKGQWTLLGG